jgi:ADP-ribosylglycohydrolase
MKSGPSLEDRFQGCLLGLAIGDALGYPTEFLTLQEIRKRYGPSGIEDLPGSPALHSDDTQMSMAVCLALIKAGHSSVENLMEVLGQEFLRWLRSPENDRSPGNTSIKGCQALESGVPWNQSGLLESKGCGANMRVAPIGLYYGNNLPKLRLVARSSALVTHAHPTALVAAEITALCVAWAAQGVAPGDYLNRIRDLRSSSMNAWDSALGDPWMRARFASVNDYLAEGWMELWAALDRVPQAVSQRSEDVCELCGGGWIAEEALACALACVLKSPEDYGATIRRGANSSGDSDSIASIAGGISGALLGVKAIRKEWRKRIENRQSLIDLSKQLYLEHRKKGAASSASSPGHGA